MKKALLLIVAALSGAVTSTEAAYDSFRVVSTEVVLESAPQDATPEELLQERKRMNVSFTCNPGSKYALWASDKLDGGTWYCIQTMTAGEDFTTLSQNEGGEDVVTTVVPVPFFTWSQSKDRQFLRVSEISPPQIGPIYAPMTGLVNHGEYITLTFLSEPGEYTIYGSSSPVGDDWCPVDTYNVGSAQVIQSFNVYASGTETTVQLANPLLPWINKDRGYILISRKSPPYQPSLSPFPIQHMLAQQNFWSLVCTRDGADDPATRHGDAGVGGSITVHLDSTGPERGDAGKYARIKASGGGNLYGPLVTDSNVRMPPVEDPEKPEDSTLKQFIRLSFYDFTDSSKVPEVKFSPNPDKRSGTEDEFEFLLQIQSGSVIGVGANKPAEPLTDGIKIEKGSIGFDIKIPSNSGSKTASQDWQFEPMDIPTLQAFLEAMEIEEGEP